jgi:hypothetical protein
MQVSFQHLENTHLLDKLYHNYVFSYWRNLMKREAKDAGVVEKLFTRNKVYKRRDNVSLFVCWLRDVMKLFIQRCKLRMEHQILRAWPVRVQRLISENACHSDDEDAPNGNFYSLYMTQRSEKADTFIKDLDHFIAASNSYSRRRNAYKRVDRTPHPDSHVSQLECLPSPKVALDWHSPDHFNNLPVHIRARYRKSPIALPLEKDMTTSDDWKDLQMSDEQFMKKYGDEVRAQYFFPTEEEIFAMEHGVLPDEESSDDGGDTVRGETDDEDGDEINADSSEEEEEEEEEESVKESGGEDESASEEEEEESAKESGGEDESAPGSAQEPGEPGQFYEQDAEMTEQESEESAGGLFYPESGQDAEMTDGDSNETEREGETGNDMEED